MKILQENRRLHVQSGDTSLTKTGNAKAIKKKKRQMILQLNK